MIRTYELQRRDRRSLRDLTSGSVLVSRHRKRTCAIVRREIERRKRRREVGHNGFYLDYAIKETTAYDNGCVIVKYLRGPYDPGGFNA